MRCPGSIRYGDTSRLHLNWLYQMCLKFMALKHTLGVAVHVHVGSSLSINDDIRFKLDSQHIQKVNACIYYM